MNKELELEAMNMLKNKWSHLYTFGYPQRPFPTNYENDLNSVMIGLTSKYVERQKLEFAKTELEKFRSKLGGYDMLSGLLKQELEIQIYELEKKLSEL